MISLVNGPLNGSKIHDSGAVTIRMAIQRKNGDKITVGEASYEPSQDRSMAFWEGNKWLGELDKTVPA